VPRFFGREFIYFFSLQLKLLKLHDNFRYSLFRFSLENTKSHVKLQTKTKIFPHICEEKVKVCAMEIFLGTRTAGGRRENASSETPAEQNALNAPKRCTHRSSGFNLSLMNSEAKLKKYKCACRAKQKLFFSRSKDG
jgi:hypothetical protein